MYTDKKLDKIAREHEKKLHSELQKLDGASYGEQAVGQLRIAKKMLKDTESVNDLVKEDTIISPNNKSDATPEQADSFYKETRKKFRKDFKAGMERNPELAKTKGAKKIWAMGRDLRY